MPKVAEIKEIDGEVWVRIHIAGEKGAVTLWTEEERREALRMAYHDGWEDAQVKALIERIAETPIWQDTYPDGPDLMDGHYEVTPQDVRDCRAFEQERYKKGVRAAAHKVLEPKATLRPADLHTIIAGIRQFGLAADGSDLRDLEAAIDRLQQKEQD